MTGRAIDAFADWFGSVACVVQTLVVCAALVVAEAVWPTVDPHGFRYLYALTVYSAVTQPALAYAAERLARFLRQTIAMLLQLAQNEEVMLDALAETLDAVREHLAKERIV